jgi:glycosyltransferase involved in cell wall biosynthesis
MSDDLKLLVYNPLSTRMGGGGDRWLAEVLPRLVSRGFEITLMTTNFIPRDYRKSTTTSFVKRIRSAGVDYEEIPTILDGRLEHPLFGLESFKRLQRSVDSHDLVYFMNAYAFQDLFIWLASRMSANSPVISAQHASMFHSNYFHDLYMHTIARTVLSGFAAYHVLNQGDLEAYKKWGLDNIFLIPSGVDTEKFSPLGRERTDFFTVLYVGRLDYEKGIDILLDAIRIVNRKRGATQQEILFRICGDGPLSQLVQNHADEVPNVRYMGYVTEEELLECYRSADLFVMPSRRETFGLVAMEAMSCGLPVVTSDISGPRTFVRDSFGELIPPRNSCALASGIEKMHELWTEKPDGFRERGRLARRICQEEYTWDTVASRVASMMHSVYEDITG